MTKWQALQQERADLRAESETIIEGASERDFSAEERARLDVIEARLKSVGSDMDRIGALREQERRAAPVEIFPAEAASPKRPGIQFLHDRSTDKPWGADTGAPFGEFLQAIAIAKMQMQIDPRLYQAVAQGAGEMTGSEGGFLAGTDMMDRVDARITAGEVRSRVDRIPVSSGSNGITINVIDERSRATGSRYGGVQGYWVDEGTAPTGSRPKFHKIELKLKKLAALGYATDELLADAAALERVMIGAFGDELGFLVEDSIINGTGAGQPQGILVAPCLVSVSKETGQAAATVLHDNLKKMWARIHAPSRANAVWFINQDVEPALDDLAKTIGVGGVEPRYVSYDNNGMMRIKGRPVIAIEYAATLGTVGDIILADLSQYAFIDKGGIQGASSMHVAFTTDEMAFRATYRVDGQAKWPAALTPFKGTGNTQSPFVVLATRA